MLLIIAVLTIILLWFVYYRYRQMTILKRNGIDGPEPNLIYGNLFTHFGNSNTERFQKYFDKYGTISGYYIGNKPTVVTNDLELMKRIQIKDFNKFPDRQQPTVKYGLRPSPKFFNQIITAKGGRWKEMRSILNPTFSAMKLKLMTPIMESAIDIFLNKIDGYSKKNEEFDIYERFQLLTTDVIAKCTLGIDTDVQNNPDDPFMKAGKEVFDRKPSRILFLFTCFPELDTVLYPLRRAIQIGYEVLGLYNNLTVGRLVNKAIQLRQNVSTKKFDLLQLMLDANISEDDIKNKNTANLSMEMDIQNETDKENGHASLPKDIRTVKSLSNDEVIANAIVFYEAGFETTSTMMGFLAHILVNHQDIQDKIRQEVNELYNEEQTFDYNTVNKLSYMQCVINETMRFYPPVTAFVTRHCQEDYKYKDITIPKGSTVTFPTYHIHHNEQYWPNHDRFDPERFRDKKNVDSIAFQAFGAGPRNCIGMRFALYEAKLTLAKLLHKYRLVPGPSTEIGDLSIEYKIITETPKNGVYVKVVPIDY